MPRKKKPEVPLPPVPPEEPRTVDTPLTDEERCFVNAYLVDRNPARAYRAIHPRCTSFRYSRQMGRELRNRPNVAGEIEAAIREQSLRCQVRADMALMELVRLSFSDILELFDDRTQLLRSPRQIPYNARHAISSIKVIRTKTTTKVGKKKTTTTSDQIIEYKFWNKIEALEKLCSFLGLKTAIPPMEALLTLLPADMAREVRQLIIQAETRRSEDNALPPSLHGTITEEPLSTPPTGTNP